MMALKEIIAELEAAARQEAAGIAILETTHWEREAPDLLAGSMACLAAATRRRDALVESARLLRQQDLRERGTKSELCLLRFRDALIALRGMRRGAA